AAVFTSAPYGPLVGGVPTRQEIVAFARLGEQHAVIVVSGRLFGRVTQGGRRWPPGQAWNASVLAEGFSAIRTVLTVGKTMTGPSLAAADLFDVLPIAVLQARYAPAKRERTRTKVSAAAK